MMHAVYNESFKNRLHEVVEEDNKIGTEANISYFIQVSTSNVATLSRLMRVLYHKDNLYAIHFDKKIEDQLVTWTLREIARVITRVSAGTNLTLPSNIIVIPRKYVSYMGISMVLNTIAGMEALAESSHWDFFINLSGSDYPLLSQSQIRRILGHAKQKHPRPNFMWIDGNSDKWRNRLSDLHFDPALYEELDVPHNPGGFELLEAVPPGAKHPLANASWFSFSKCEAWMILSNELVEHIIRSVISKELLIKFAHSLASDEHFFCTLLKAQQDNFPHINSTMRFILWWHPQLGNSGARPFTLDDKWWLIGKALRCSGAFFARKFSDSNADVLEAIDTLFIRGLDKDFAKLVERKFLEMIKNSSDIH
ncbi:N-acetylglucosaminyltransferase [Galdieria sulphuraria]|uniref:protein xylosyltransferase n=1 Tax=Galdieria sulphuraria TaxID=130081 RepID=M2Y7K0_GALSU|nr:N-acetylglucosaminyltransferase [Galdieria sulphuraria]EME31804.1 N-acetylglucosaminyltransferase [Galdieria sulphuraria]|eukprot:XP_005708324.1 N-acetylglucosaminyltransferase [Galdieria sulphuraria]